MSFIRSRQHLSKQFPYLKLRKARLFAQHQEAAQKDVERSFGVLQKRWAIICEPARLWQMEHLVDIMYACIILHNMIVEDDKDSYGIRNDYTYE